MGPDTRTRCKTLARCWRGSCYGFGFAASATFLFIMMWLLWCYVGLFAIPITEPQRRGLVHFSATTSKPSFTTASNNTTAPSQMSTLNTIIDPSRSQTTQLRGNNRAEVQAVRKEVSPASRTEDSSSKEDFKGREIPAKSTMNSSTDRSKGTSSESSTDSKRFENERSRSPTMDSILVRSVSSSAPENLPDSKDDDRRSEKPSADRGKTESRDYNIDTTEQGRKSEIPPARDDYDDDRTRRTRPVDREFYDDYDKGRPPPRDYTEPDRPDRDRRILDPKDIRDEPVRRRLDDDRDYDRRPVDRDRTRYDRDPYDYPRRRYDDIDDKGRPPSRRIDDDIRVRERDREPVRRVDDDYYRPRSTSSRDDRYRDDDDRLRGDVYERRPLTDTYRDRIRDDSYLSTDDRYRSRPDERYIDRDDRYRPTDADDYRRDRYRDDERYRDRTSDDRYRRRNDRDEDLYVARPVDDTDTYRSRKDPDTSVRREDLRPRGDVGPYRDGIEPRRTMPPLPRDEKPVPVARDPIDYETRTREDIDRRENLRKSTRDDTRLDVPPRADVSEDRYRDTEYDRRRPPSTTYSSSRDDYETRDKALPLDADGYRQRERTRTRGDPRYEEDSTVRSSRPRYDADGYRSKGEESTEDDRYRRRRVDDEIPSARELPPRREDDYRGSRTATSKSDERVIDRDSPVYLAEDKVPSKDVRTKPEDVILDHRSYASSDDDYVRNRPRIDPKLSSDRDDREERYRPSRRPVSEAADDDRYEGRSRDRYDADDYRSRVYDRGYDRTDDRRYSRTDSRDLVRPTRPDPVDRVRDTIQPTRTISEDRLIRASSRDSYADETRTYVSDPRPSRVDDDYTRRDSTYSRSSESRLKREPEEVRSSRNPSQTNIREKRYQEAEDPCRSDNYRKGCIEASSSTPSRSSFDTPNRPLTPKEVIEAAYRHRDEPDRPGANIYPVFDPRVHNISSPEIIRPNERRGSTIQTRKKKK